MYETVLFTGRAAPGNGPRANWELFVYRGEEGEYHSMAAPAALVDALVLAVSVKLGPQATERLERLRRLKEQSAGRL